jgi:hypothetical protein
VDGGVLQPTADYVNHADAFTPPDEEAQTPGATTLVASGGVEPPTFRISAVPDRLSLLTKSLVVNNCWLFVDLRELP